MKNKQAINNLKQYIEQDLIYKENKPQSDFDEFCINHCEDIETALNYIEKLERQSKLMFLLGRGNGKTLISEMVEGIEENYIPKETLRKIKANTDTYRDFTEEVIKLL